MGADVVFEHLDAASPQSSSQQRIPAVLQADTAAETGASHCTLNRYKNTQITLLLINCFMWRFVFTTRWQ